MNHLAEHTLEFLQWSPVDPSVIFDLILKRREGSIKKDYTGSNSGSDLYGTPAGSDLELYGRPAVICMGVPTLM